MKKEFKLSDKRKLIYDKLYTWVNKGFADTIISVIKSQDKEFIKKLKKLNSIAINENLIKEIDKLAGDLK